jgi:hypothetical protein
MIADPDVFHVGSFWYMIGWSSGTDQAWLAHTTDASFPTGWTMDGTVAQTAHIARPSIVQVGGEIFLYGQSSAESTQQIDLWVPASLTSISKNTYLKNIRSFHEVGNGFATFDFTTLNQRRFYIGYSAGSTATIGIATGSTPGSETEVPQLQFPVGGGVLVNAGLSMGTGVIGMATTVAGAADTGLSRVAAAKVGVGNGTAADVSGTLQTASVEAAKIFPSADSTTAISINKADNSTNVVTVDTTNARVGIGTTSPGYNLDVSSAGNTAASITTPGGGAYVSTLNFSLTGFGSPASIAYSDITHNFNFNATHASSYLSFGTANTERLRIFNSGNLSVGTNVLGMAATVAGASDTGLSRVAAGVVGVGTGAAGSVAGRIALDNSTPANAAVACTAQSVWADASFIYVCTASGAVKRVAIAAW